MIGANELKETEKAMKKADKITTLTLGAQASAIEEGVEEQPRLGLPQTVQKAVSMLGDLESRLGLPETVQKAVSMLRKGSSFLVVDAGSHHYIYNYH
ncbi:hypothetical protein CBR_g9090 [Chara braunii]|uniref:Uncharacterized protein n=1 Tax=Chara braunii TaxID=69332 RepID=A0A388KNP0_CHABU|nr:hypothetical protein CBR_g9090 [Chara braunii]|eukprot:GBG71676.1 hypothetical protein CBR_g9090 [Chara braunii]